VTQGQQLFVNHRSQQHQDPMLPWFYASLHPMAPTAGCFGRCLHAGASTMQGLQQLAPVPLHPWTPNAPPLHMLTLNAQVRSNHVSQLALRGHQGHQLANLPPSATFRSCSRLVFTGAATEHDMAGIVRGVHHASMYWTELQHLEVCEPAGVGGTLR
jgi:hypothetical protein